MPSDKMVLCPLHASRHAGTQIQGKRRGLILCPPATPEKDWIILKRLKRKGRNGETATALGLFEIIKTSFVKIQDLTPCFLTSSGTRPEASTISLVFLY